MGPSEKIFVAGHRGLVGSALVRRLGERGYDNLVTRTHADLDLTDQTAVQRQYDAKHIGECANIGVGEDIAIGRLAEMIAEIVGFHGELVFDAGKPDGTPRKLLDVSKLTRLGWKAKTSLREGIAKTYDRYLATLHA